MNQTILLIVSYIIITLVSIGVFSSMISFTTGVADNLGKLSESNIPKITNIADASNSSLNKEYVEYSVYYDDISALEEIKTYLMNINLISAIILGLNFACLIFICVYYIISRFSSITVKVEKNTNNYSNVYQPSLTTFPY